MIGAEPPHLDIHFQVLGRLDSEEVRVGTRRSYIGS
jgi:hypothetical protein